MAFRPGDWPARCADGHPLGPGTGSLSFARCDTCEIPGHGHDYLVCGTCGMRLWLGHPGAVWMRRSGTGWVPA